MDRKAIARETLGILEQGYYELPSGRVEIAAAHRASVAGSRFFPAEETPPLPPVEAGNQTEVVLWDCSTVEAVLRLAAQGAKGVGVLNFASAKNPGGGFLNGAMAQEESLAASGGLYPTLTRHPAYYDRNRACRSMVYTGCAIYSPEVVFFRDGAFRLLEHPVTASVLTLPAVNLGQVMQTSPPQGPPWRSGWSGPSGFLGRWRTGSWCWGHTAAGCSATIRRMWPGGGRSC